MDEHFEMVICLFCDEICNGYHTRVYSFLDRQFHVCNQCSNNINNYGVIQLVYDDNLKKGEILFNDYKVKQKLCEKLMLDRMVMKQSRKLNKLIM